MSAGYIQLAAIGQQDAYLTGSPQVTYFLGVYRRHTPFVLEAYDIPFLDQKLQYGQNHICRIPPKGDLVRSLMLRMTLPALQVIGTDWYWPIAPSVQNAATLIFNGNTSFANVAPFAGIDWYSTFNQANWLNGPGPQGVFKPNVAYLSTTNKFVFSNVANVWVPAFAPNQTNVGVFWGLDPRNANAQTTIGAVTYLIYNVGPSGRTSDFSLEQSGWLRNPSTGMPDPPAGSGLFLGLNQSKTLPPSGFINFASESGVTKWTNYDPTTSFAVTPGGRINFQKTGLYIMRVGFGADYGSLSNVAWGAQTGDGEPDFPTFTASYPWRVSPNPATPAIFPMNITTTAANVYVYAYSTGSALVSSSYVSIIKADYVFSLASPYGSGVSLTSTGAVPIYSNIVETGSGFVSLTPDATGRFNINQYGPMIITGTLYLSSNYVSNVQLVEGANILYTYDMTAQGRDPTFAFSMPVNVTDTARFYSLNVATNNTWSDVMTLPGVPTSNTGSTGQWYANTTTGQFLMNASTESITQPAWKGFSTGNYWQAGSFGMYSLTPPYSNVVTAPVTNTTPGPISWGGEWIQLVAPTQTLLTAVTITPVSADLAPGECLILGNSLESNSGWTILNGPTTLNGSSQTIPISTTSAFRWFRVVFTKALNGVNGYKPAVNVSMTGRQTAKILLNGSFFVINQIGVPASTLSSIVLQYNGMLMTPSTTTLKTPLRLTTDFTTIGNVFNISNVTSQNTLAFSNVGMYMVTGVLSTADQLTSLTIAGSDGSSTIFPVGLGMYPPVTVNLPFRVSNTAARYSISLSVNGSTAAPNLYSNTFLAVYPVSSNVNTPPNYVYYDSVATLAIQSAELKIGGQSIETLTGEYIELWNDLNVPYENQPALKLLTGKGDTSTQILTARTYYVNLPFYFYNRPELAIPLVTLDRQDVEIHVKFNTFDSLTAITGVVNPTLDATIITEYVYLSEPEINWFRTSRIEQVITQCQYGNFRLQPNFTTGVFVLDFKNPVREMFFVIQVEGAAPYDYSGNGLESIAMSFNGYEAMSASTNDAVSLGSLEPFNHYPNFPTRQFYMHSFCMAPGSTAPSGYVNFSRIKQVLLTLNTSTNALGRNLRLAFVSHNVLRFENGLAGLMFNQ
jgi:hypothetical protein